MDTKLEQISAWLGSGSINLFGRPFAGKDTQGRMLVELFDGVLIAGGDILRSFHGQAELEKIMSSGRLIPTDMYMNIVVPYLSRPELAGKPLILSAVGRLKGEEPTILQATAESGHPTKAVILLDLSEQEVWKRFEASKTAHDRGNRTDDYADVLQVRLQKFNDQTLPVIEAYRQQGLLVEVDGTQPPATVNQLIVDQLYRLATAH